MIETQIYNLGLNKLEIAMPPFPSVKYADACRIVQGNALFIISTCLFLLFNKIEIPDMNVVQDKGIT